MLSEGQANHAHFALLDSDFKFGGSLEKVTLANGVRVLVETADGCHSAAAVVGIDGGLADETYETAGLTHVLEHLLFKRTSKLSTSQIADMMDEFGGEINAFTDVNSMCLYGTVPADRLPALIDFFSELLLDAKFGKDELKVEKEIIRQEILESADNPSDVVYQNMCECLWPDSIFRLPVFGTLASLEKITVTQIRERLKEMLKSNRIFIAVAGKVDADALLKQVEKNFGSLDPIPYTAEDVPEPKYGSRLVVHPGHQVHLALCRRFPANGDENYLESLVFTTVFGEGASSRLFQVLREEHGLAYDVGASVESLGNLGLFHISAILERDSIHQALELILSELHKVRESSISLAELKRVKNFVSAQFEMDLDSVSARLWRMIETEIQGKHFVSAEEFLSKLKAIELADITRFIERHVSLSGNAIVLGGDVNGLELQDDIKRFCGLIC